MSCIAVIPARGGSKRIPGKNLKRFLGIPIIERVIREAISSGCFDRIIVSTDDSTIAEIALQAGAEVPFLRPVVISDDHTSTIAVIRHAITEMVQTLESDIICCLYPTSVFVTEAMLKAGLEIVVNKEYDYVISAVSFGHPVQRGFTLSGTGKLDKLDPKGIMSRTQDLEKYYHDAGQFYWAKAQSWLCNDKIIGSESHAIVFSGDKVHDIDTPEDWAIAELLFKISITDNR